MVSTIFNEKSWLIMASIFPLTCPPCVDKEKTGDWPIDADWPPSCASTSQSRADTCFAPGKKAIYGSRWPLSSGNVVSFELVDLRGIAK